MKAPKAAATRIVEPDPFREAGENAARRRRIACADEEMHGRLGRRDKDSAERWAQLDHGRKRDGPLSLTTGAPKLAKKPPPGAGSPAAATFVS